MRPRDVVVVGGGHNGLVAATLLAKRGHDVLVLERRNELGGAAATEEVVPGYRFSTCAYAAHLLHERVLEAVGIEPAELRLRPLGPRVLVLPEGAVVREDDVDDPAAQRWRDELRAVASLLDRFVLGRPPSVDELAAAAREAGLAEVFRRFARLSLRELLAETFASPVARAIFAPRYSEADPAAPGGPLAAAWVEVGAQRPPELQGVPEGGMGTVAAAFARAARAAGVEVRTGVEVSQIVVVGRRVRGIRLPDGRPIAARAVLSNADVRRTILRLVPPAEVPPRAREQVEAVPAGPGAAKLHLALRGEPDLSLVGDDAGLVHVLPSLAWLERAWTEVSLGRWPDSALVELQLPSVRDRSLAPPDGHTLSVYLPLAAPHLDGRGWDERRRELTELLLERAERAIPNVRGLVRASVVHTPPDLARRLTLPGSIHHVPHAAGWMGDERPLPGWADGSTPIAGLFLCGASIHPGGEVSGAPGYNAARTAAAWLDAS